MQQLLKSTFSSKPSYLSPTAPQPTFFSKPSYLSPTAPSSPFSSKPSYPSPTYLLHPLPVQNRRTPARGFYDKRKETPIRHLFVFGFMVRVHLFRLSATVLCLSSLFRLSAASPKTLQIPLLLNIQPLFREGDGGVYHDSAGGDEQDDQQI